MLEVVRVGRYGTYSLFSVALCHFSCVPGAKQGLYSVWGCVPVLNVSQVCRVMQRLGFIFGAVLSVLEKESVLIMF